MLLVFGSVQQGYVALGQGFFYFFHKGSRFQIGFQLLLVAGGEFRELFRIVAEGPTQSVGGSNLLVPTGKGCVFLLMPRGHSRSTRNRLPSVSAGSS